MAQSRTEQLPRREPWRLSVGKAVAGVLAVPVGLGLSVFGFLGWCVGPVVLITGLVGRRLNRRWARWALWTGVGLTAGALVYVTSGLLTPDGPSSGSGSGSATG